MATYRTIAASETNPTAPLVSGLMKALADNPTAIAEGAAGAPRNQTASMEDAAITRIKLKTATASQSFSGNATITLNPYSFIPAMTGNGTATFVSATGATVDSPRIQVTSTGSGSVTWRYIDA